MQRKCQGCNKTFTPPNYSMMRCRSCAKGEGYPKKLTEAEIEERKKGVKVIMNVKFIPHWDGSRGGEVYKVILEKENGEFSKNKVSMEFGLGEYINYVVSVKNGVLSLKKVYFNNYHQYLVDNGVAEKGDLDEITIVLKEGFAKYSEIIKKVERNQDHEGRKNEWLNAPVYQVEIKGWE